MFNKTNTAVTESAPVEVIQVVSLSVLALDLGEPSTGWAAHLADRGIEIVLDDLGRACIARADAKQLFDEQRESEARKREKLAEYERQAIEADRLRRESIWRGLPAIDLPVGVPPVVAMTEAVKAAQPRRESVLQHALGNSGELVFHPITQNGDEA